MPSPCKQVSQRAQCATVLATNLRRVLHFDHEHAPLIYRRHNVFLFIGKWTVGNRLCHRDSQL